MISMLIIATAAVATMSAILASFTNQSRVDRHQQAGLAVMSAKEQLKSYVSALPVSALGGSSVCGIDNPLETSSGDVTCLLQNYNIGTNQKLIYHVKDVGCGSGVCKQVEYTLTYDDPK